MQFTLFSSAPLPVAPLGPRERLACLRLIRSDNVGPVAFRQLINHFGGAEAALEALPDVARRGGSRSIRIFPKGEAERELAAAQRIGAVPLFTIEPGYPHALAAVDHPPPMIYGKGRIELLNRPGIAIVGSRNCSAAGHAFARQLATGLGSAGLVVISGLARGIDGAAHEASLESGTIAVLAGGLDIFYPPEHRALQHDISERGCLVSEMPPGFKPRAQEFPRRNRIISGMSYGVVVVEAARRSGTLITARLANEQGREVFAVPGHPLDPRAEGTNRLIKSGATMIIDADDIIDVVRPMLPERLGDGLEDGLGNGLGDGQGKQGEHTSRSVKGGPFSEQAAPTAQPEPAAFEATDEQRLRVEQALGAAPIHVDSVLRATGLSVPEVQIALLELSLAGRLEHHGAHLVSLRAAVP